MTTPIQIGLERLVREKNLISKVRGNVGYLCHSASVTPDFTLGVLHLQKMLKGRLKQIFGPQHGFVTDVQDNMVESGHYTHPFFKLPIYSLYSDTRIPTDQMLEGLDSIIVDLQDVGTRVYTYISTLGLLIQKCAEKKIQVVILDRPNPAGGELIEGNILESSMRSFVGHFLMPMRHAMTMGEVAIFAAKYQTPNTDLLVIPMKGWKRKMFWKDTGLPWVNPSPNLSTPESALTFVGTVLFEGTNISEGRGTTRALEMVGHPKIEPFSFLSKMEKEIKKARLTGFTLRPTLFWPTFQKHQNISCGGFHIHPTNPKTFRSWRLGQLLCRELKKELGKDFEWKKPPYEYEKDKRPIDLINGSSQIAQWVDNHGSMSDLLALEQKGMKDFLKKRKECLLYE